MKKKRDMYLEANKRRDRGRTSLL